MGHRLIFPHCRWLLGSSRLIRSLICAAVAVSNKFFISTSAYTFVELGLSSKFDSGQDSMVSAKRTPSCKDSRRIAMLRYDQAFKEGQDEVAKAGFRAGA